jgi:2-methylcitrate dehydratase PrpD
MALAERVTVLEDRAITAKGAKHRHEVRVQVELRDGRRLERTQATPRGSEQSFAPPAAIIAKFETLARRALSPQQIDELRDAVLSLETLPSAARLAGLLSSAKVSLDPMQG